MKGFFLPARDSSAKSVDRACLHPFVCLLAQKYEAISALSGDSILRGHHEKAPPRKCGRALLIVYVCATSEDPFSVVFGSHECSV